MRRPTRLARDIHWPSDEEEARINRGIARDPDSPELTAEDFARMRPAAKVVPKIVTAHRKGRLGRPPIGEAPKVHIGFRWAADVVEGIRATGPGYNARVERLLRKALAKGEL